MATLAPILNADLDLQIHVAAACLSILLAPVIVYRKRRDQLHKLMGYIWVTAMMVCAISSFWLQGIRMIGPFSPIHLLSVWTIFGLIYAVRQAIRGKIRAHMTTMKSIAFWALGVAGTLSFMPGRTMNDIAFPDAPLKGFVTIFLFFALVVSGAHLRQRRFGVQNS